MPTNYTGVPGNITTPLTATVTGATNTSPIVITTSGAHLFGDGDTVLVLNVGGNTAANGRWTITVLSSTTFSLNGSTGSSAYTSGGTAVDYSLTPYGQLPSDGDTLNVSSINPFLMMLADRTQYLGMTAPKIQVFTASGSLYTGPNTYAALIWGYGGGSGGGRGQNGAVSNAVYAYGLGGGAGAKASWRYVLLSPNTTYAVTIGAGGTGGATAGAPGAAGGDTTLGTVAFFPGAAPGKTTGSTAASGGSASLCVLGGTPDPSDVVLGSYFDFSYPTIGYRPMLQEGGLGLTGTTSGQAGASSEFGVTGYYAGGVGGTPGSLTDGGYKGGGPGGGGGAGPGGAGGAGGAGSDGHNGANSSNATGGTSAGANSGAGGGGGGGAGCCASGTPGNGGTGGNGGSGKLIVITFGG